jgi:sensor domain CHASE-containing protein
MSLTSNAHPAALPPWARSVTAGTGVVAALLGVTVLIGWYLHLPALIQLRPGFAPMQYNSAVCFILAGCAVLSLSFGRRSRLPATLGFLVTAIGTATLAEYLSQIDLGIDQALFHSYITDGISCAGRMSPVSAFCFTLAGLAFLCLTVRAAAGWRSPVAGSIASIIVSISLVALLGYMFHLPGTYGWGQLTQVAAHTAAGLGLIGAALFIIAWSNATHPGERTPRWLPVPLALGVFVASLILYFALNAKQQDDIADTVKTSAENVRNQLTVRLEARSRALNRMAKRWEFAGAQSQSAWEADATNYLHDFPDWQAVEWLDATHRVRWIVPLAGNEDKIGRDLTQEPVRKAALAQATGENQPIVSRIFTLFRGGLGFVVYVPIVLNGQSNGSLAAVVQAQGCFARYLPSAVAEGEAITLSQDGRQFFSRAASAPPLSKAWVAQQTIELHGVDWDLRMWPTPELAARLNSPLPGIVLLAGILGALLLAAVCHYAQRAARHAAETARHAAETERANAALQAALDNVKTLEGLLPICTGCKRIRDDSGYWNQIDSYISRNTNASLSHGYCPECAAKAFTDFGYDVPPEVEAAVAAGNYE